MNFMLTCREVAEAKSRDQMSQLSVWRRAMIRLHLLRCRDCQSYSEQLRAISQAANGLYEDDREGSESGALDELEASILRELEGGPDQDRPPSDL